MVGALAGRQRIRSVSLCVVFYNVIRNFCRKNYVRFSRFVSLSEVSLAVDYCTGLPHDWSRFNDADMVRRSYKQLLRFGGRLERERLTDIQAQLSNQSI